MGQLMSCLECARLRGQYRDATKAWQEANKEVTDSALTHEAEMFSSALGKRHLALKLAKEAAQDLREHMRAAHGQVHDIRGIPKTFSSVPVSRRF